MANASSRYYIDRTLFCYRRRRRRRPGGGGGSKRADQLVQHTGRACVFVCARCVTRCHYRAAYTLFSLSLSLCRARPAWLCSPLTDQKPYPLLHLLLLLPRTGKKENERVAICSLSLSDWRERERRRKEEKEGYIFPYRLFVPPLLLYICR